MPNWVVHIGADAMVLGVSVLLSARVRADWHRVGLALLASNLIDIDHLLADPPYDPERCSIGTHPLHSWYAFPVYVAGLFARSLPLRFLAAGILLHLGLDALDCVM